MAAMLTIGAVVVTVIVARIAFALGSRQSNAPVIIVNSQGDPMGGGVGEALLGLGIFLAVVYFVLTSVPPL